MEMITELSKELKDRGAVLIIFEAFFSFFLFFVAIIGNSCVLLAVYRNAQLRTIPNFFVAALAISDILLPLMCVPQTIATTILGRWPFSHDACQAQGYFVITLACASFQILTLTALNRFYRIVRTTHYRSTFTKNKTIIMIALCSGLACFEPIPYLLSGKRYVFHPGKAFCVQAKDISFPNFIIFLFLCVPAFTLSVCYFVIFKKLRSHQQMVQNNLHSSTLSGRITHRDIKVTKILFITVIGFLTCWTPLTVIDFVDTFRGEVSFPRQVYFMYFILGNLSGVINPFIYGFLQKNFREEYKKIFGICRLRHGRVHNVQEGGT